MINDSTPGIVRRSRLPRRALLNDYILPERPVILTDAVEEWEAIGKWTPAFFKKNYPNVSLEVSGTRYTMPEQIDRIMNSSPAEPAPYPYSLEVGDHFPELLPDIEPQLVLGKIDRVTHPLMPRALIHGTPFQEIFFGGHGSSFPFVHYDALQLHTQITQIYGEKEFLLYAPSDAPYMYPRPDNEKFSQVTDVFNPDLDRFPLFRHAKPFRCVLGVGETIYFPRGWWHTTRMFGPSISYGRIVLNGTNYQAYLDDKYARWKRSGAVKANLAYGVGKLVGGAMRVAEAFT